MESRVWMRMGDSGDYEDFDSPFDAGSGISYYFDALDVKRLPKVSKYGRYGVEVGDSFLGPYNYVSLFWGDDDAQPTKDVTKADIASFRAGLSEGLDLPRRVVSKPKSVKRKPKSRSRDGDAQLRMMR